MLMTGIGRTTTFRTSSFVVAITARVLLFAAPNAVPATSWQRRWT